MKGWMIRRDQEVWEWSWNGVGKKWEGSSVNRVGFRQKDDGGWITWPGMCIEGKMPVWGCKSLSPSTERRPLKAFFFLWRGICGLSYGWRRVFIGIEENSFVFRNHNLAPGVGMQVIWPGMSLLKGGSILQDFHSRGGRGPFNTSYDLNIPRRQEWERSKRP